MGKVTIGDYVRETVATETEIVQTARKVILKALTDEMYADSGVMQINVAKWVIENIWTPDAEAA